jgi:hypothetical protein
MHPLSLLCHFFLYPLSVSSFCVSPICILFLSLFRACHLFVPCVYPPMSPLVSSYVSVFCKCRLLYPLMYTFFFKCRLLYPLCIRFFAHTKKRRQTARLRRQTALPLLRRRTPRPRRGLELEQPMWLDLR